MWVGAVWVLVVWIAAGVLEWVVLFRSAGAMWLGNKTLVKLWMRVVWA